MKKLVYYLKRVKMKLLKTSRYLLIFLFALAVITACKKDAPEQIQPDSSPVQQLTRDDSSVEGNLDAVFSDVALVLSTTKKMDVPCGATLDSVVELNDKMYYYLTYDGLNCQETRYRRGKIWIAIKKNDSWLNKNTKVDVYFFDYEVTNVFDYSKTVTNGSADYTNVSGGIIAFLGSGINTVIHRINAYLEITFDGNPERRDWKLHKMMVYSGSPGNFQVAVNGFGNQQGQSNLLSWGTDREGRNFLVQCDESVVYRQACEWLPGSGILRYSYPEDKLQATVSFGYNNSNEHISGSECPTRYKLDWSQQGQSGTIFLPL
jgi:hypothetical protein